jgi:hypothetical protein
VQAARQPAAHKTQADESNSGCAFIDDAFWFGSHVISSLSICHRYTYSNFTDSVMYRRTQRTQKKRKGRQEALCLL